MLKAQKAVWFEKIFAVYNRNLFKRQFHSLNVSGLDVLQKRDKKIPLIIYANHSSWWDGLIAFEISRIAKLDGFVMMEEKHLKKLFLFRRLGAFSVVRENPRAAIKSINYAAEILVETSNRTLWIFPQGEILHNDLRPLKFYNGLTRIIEKIGQCYAAPVAMRYEFLTDYKPKVFVQIGKVDLFFGNENFKRRKIINILELKLTETLNALKCDIQNKNFTKFEKV
ncbi:MAG: lysophospholipid acyltransferase family protein [Acidobacteria bacterium]|nr:lysophospholipid acyltransferase family protein [Acidobacteriota bacterium]MCA1637765.1 lysophospholipid acyltransferase family protein [Acidobacteriota bacterium]